MKGPDLGTVLAVLRVAAGWTVDDLATATGLRRSTITDYERGRFVPGLNTVERVFRAMGYPFSALDVARTCIGLMRATQKHPAVSAARGIEPT